MADLGNTGNDPDEVLVTDAGIETAAYDALPAKLRQCIAHQPLKMSAVQAKELYDSGLPVGVICRHIEQFSREHMRKARAEGR